MRIPMEIIVESSFIGADTKKNRPITKAIWPFKLDCESTTEASQ